MLVWLKYVNQEERGNGRPEKVNMSYHECLDCITIPGQAIRKSSSGKQ